MKKLWLVSALSLGLVLLAGCNTTSTQTPVEITSTEQLMSMYNETKAITCNITYSDEEEEWTSVMYIKDGMISQETKSTMEWEEATMYTMAKDGKMYVWWSVYGEGVWMSATYELDLEEELQWFDEVDDNTKVTCTKGVKNNSAFNLPSDIEFTSMDDLFGYDLEDYEYDESDLNEEFNWVEANEGNDEAEENIENEVAEENGVVEENVEEVVTE